MKWFVGLGNPGQQYAKTRHNIGFMALDRFAEQHDIAFKPHTGFKAFVGEGRVSGAKVYVLKPQTYMNLSGESMRAFMDFYKAPIEDLIVVYDDIDTVFGSIRLRYKGSAGGHNGIKSLIQHAGTQSFCRIRMGVDRPAPGQDLADYVLSPFRKEEFEQLPAVLDRTCEAMKHAVQHDFEKTMALFNA